MTLHLFLILLVVLGTIITGILFVFFGEKTVRKLRKDPATKNALGLEFFISGMDIANVAFALILPRKLNRLAKKKNPFLAQILFVDVDLLYKHTTRFDQILGRAHAYSSIFTVLAMFLLIYLEEIGYFK